MALQFIILLLIALACPIGMGTMMWWMHRSMNPSPAAEISPPRQPKTTEDIITRNQALESRVAELERHLTAQQPSEH
jgi:hypothetical protein